MRNLKKVLSVLLVVAIMAVSMVPAFAAESFKYEKEAKALYDLGLFKGVSPDSFNPDLGSALTREQGFALIVRLLGKADDAAALKAADVDAALAAFGDAKVVEPTLKNTVAYAVKNNLVKGDGKLIDPKGAMLGKDLATVILRNLGYEVEGAAYDTATTTLAEKGGLTAAEASAFATKKLIRDDLVGMSYGSLKATYKTGETVIAKLIADKDVDEAKAIAAGVITKSATATSITAKATGKAVITVTFDSAVDSSKAKFAVKNVTGTADVKAAFAADKKSATLTTSTKFVAGEYTVTASGISDKDLTAKVTFEDEKVGKITFNTDKAVLVDDTGLSVYAYFKVLNQYNEDVTSRYYGDSNLTITSSNYTTSTTKEGKIKITTGSGDTFTYGESVPVSIVYTNEANVVTATSVLTVSTKAGMGEVAISKLYNDLGKTLDLNSTTYESFYLIFDLKDQYGNVLTFDGDQKTIEDDLIITSGNSTVVSIPTRPVTRIKDGVSTIKTVPDFQEIVIDGQDKIALPVAKPTGTALSGSSIITAVSSTTGKMAQFTVEVKDGTYAASFTMQQPDVAVIGEKIIIPFTAFDPNGKEITDVDDLKTGNNDTKVTLRATGTGISDSDVSFEENPVTGKAQLVLNTIGKEGSITKDSTVTVTSLTGKTYKTSVLNLKMKEAKKPDSISSVSSSYVKKMVAGGFAEFKLGNVTVYDQYGRPYTTEELRFQTTKYDGYRIAITSSNDDNIVVAGVGGKAYTNYFYNNVIGDKAFLFAKKEGSASITLALEKLEGGVWKDLNIKTSFTMTAIPLSDVVDYSVSEIKGDVFNSPAYADSESALQTTLAKGNYDKGVGALASTIDRLWDTAITVTGLTADGSKVWLSQEYIKPTVAGTTYSAYTIYPSYTSKVRVLPETTLYVDMDGNPATTADVVYAYYKQKLNIYNDITPGDDESIEVPFTVAVNLENSKLISGLKLNVKDELPEVASLTLVHYDSAELSADKASIEIDAIRLSGGDMATRIRNVVNNAVKAVDQYGIEQSKESTNTSFYQIISVVKAGTSDATNGFKVAGDQVEVTVISKSGAKSIKFTITVK